MSPQQNQARNEATSFEHDAQLDFHKASEHIIPAHEFYTQEIDEIDAKTREAMAIAAQNGLERYTSDGISEVEQYLQYYTYVGAVGVNIAAMRQFERK